MQKAFILKMSWTLGPCWPMNRSGQKVKPSVTNEGLVALCRVFRIFAYFPTTLEDSGESQGALCKCFFPMCNSVTVLLLSHVGLWECCGPELKWACCEMTIYLEKGFFFKHLASRDWKISHCLCVLESNQPPGLNSPRVKWGFIFLLVPFIIGRDAENSGPPKVLLFHSI